MATRKRTPKMSTQAKRFGKNTAMLGGSLAVIALAKNMFRRFAPAQAQATAAQYLG